MKILLCVDPLCSFQPCSAWIPADLPPLLPDSGAAAAALDSAFNFQQQVNRQANERTPKWDDNALTLTKLPRAAASFSRTHKWAENKKKKGGEKTHILTGTAEENNKTSCCMKKRRRKSSTDRFERAQQTCRGACTVLCMVVEAFQLTKQV